MQKKNYNTKKKGKTEVYPFWNMEDIKNMIDWFKRNEEWDCYLTFMFQFLFGRRIGDVLDMKWEDIFYENGKMKNEIKTIVEQKTGKINTIYISPYAKAVIDDYLFITERNPMNNLSGYIFEFDAKTLWKKREDDQFYNEINSKEEDCDCMELIDYYCKIYNKDFSEKRKLGIISKWQKKKDEYPTLGKFIYFEEEFMDIIKWQQDKYRKKFKQASEECGIEYEVSTHSVRKSFGYWSKQIHPHDIMCLETLQNIFGHSDTQTTMHYIGLSAEREKMYYNDIGEFLENVSHGDYDLKQNSPVVTLKEADMRKVIMAAMETTDESDVDKLNRILDMVSELKVE